MTDLDALGPGASWDGVRVAVVGFDLDGQSAADNLLHLGADVTVVDPEPTAATEEFADLLGVLGADIRRGGPLDAVCDLVVTTGSPSATAVVQQLRSAQPGIVVFSVLDVARRLSPDQVWMVVGVPDGPADSIAHAHQVAGGAAAMLRAAGVRAAVAGLEQSAMELVSEPDPYEVLVVAATPGMLAASGSLRPHSSCVLAASVGLEGAFTDVEGACVYKPEDPATEAMVGEAEVIEGARAIGVVFGTPGPSMLGVVEDVLCDRAFVENRQTSAAEICTLSQLRDPSQASVEAVLAAVALVRAYGVALAPIRLCISETF